MMGNCISYIHRHYSGFGIYGWVGKKVVQNSVHNECDAYMTYSVSRHYYARYTECFHTVHNVLV